MSTNLPPGAGQAPEAPNPQDDEFYASYVHLPSLPTLNVRLHTLGLALTNIKRSRDYSMGTKNGMLGKQREKLIIRWGLCILCVLLIGALITSYYLQIKRIRAVHETVISIFAGMVVGLIIRLSPGHVIREMLVSPRHVQEDSSWPGLTTGFYSNEADLASRSIILCSSICYYRQSS